MEFLMSADVIALKEKEEERFRGAVAQSDRAVRAWGEHMLNKGHPIIHQPIRLRPSFEARQGYGDDSDISVLFRYEVKGRTVQFTCADDFPYDTVFVDRKDKADKNADVVHAYVTLNKALTHFALIRSSTRQMWTTSERFDSVKGHKLCVYECPKEHVIFGMLSSKA
jgi:hypothetical protein